MDQTHSRDVGKDKIAINFMVSLFQWNSEHVIKYIEVHWYLGFNYRGYNCRVGNRQFFPTQNNLVQSNHVDQRNIRFVEL